MFPNYSLITDLYTMHKDWGEREKVALVMNNKIIKSDKI